MDLCVKDQTIEDFTSVLASRAPVPGGGGASAVAGSVGAALGAMVCELTRGKKRYAEVEPRVCEIADELGRVRADLLALADADARAFEPLSRAYGLPRGTEEERAHKAKVMEVALLDACDPPLQIMERICDAVELVDEVSRIGSKIAISDAGAGAALLSSAQRAASLNVFINTKSMADRDRALELEARAQELLDRGCEAADAAFKRVERGIRWQS